MSTPGALRVVEALAVHYRRSWRLAMATSFLNPLLFLLAMGVGLGSLVDGGTAGAGAASLGGAGYLDFLAPGLLAATAVQVGAAESTYPVLSRVKWNPTYPAMLATPLEVGDLVNGQLGWIGLRLLQTTTLFALVMVMLGALGSWWGVLAVPVAALCGLALAAPICAVSASLQRDVGLASILRFGIMPMFLFSGTFFPVSQLPALLQPVAYATPLWHGVDLCRRLCLGTAGAARSLGHLAYLALWLAVGAAVATRAYRRRLVK
ncbi:MAG: ABC transporter permease [Acidimicrobiia bacterium]